jgi:hypothetical protein
MKQYVIDELRLGDYNKLKTYLEAHFQAAAIPGIYRIKLGEEILTPVQAAHTDCQPFFFSMELEPQRISCELLVRSEQIMRCNCIANATTEQRAWLMDTVDTIFEHLDLST